MAELKFRAWDKEENKMWNVETLYIEDEWVKVNDGSIYGLTKDLIRSYCLMQSTGLRDKNGVEVYEGDIVENSYKEIGFIKNSNDAFCFNRKERNFYLSGIGAGSPFKILGNIYENPELLEDN